MHCAGQASSAQYVGSSVVLINVNVRRTLFFLCMKEIGYTVREGNLVKIILPPLGLNTYFVSGYVFYYYLFIYLFINLKMTKLNKANMLLNSIIIMINNAIITLNNFLFANGHTSKMRGKFH